MNLHKKLYTTYKAVATNTVGTASAIYSITVNCVSPQVVQNGACVTPAIIGGANPSPTPTCTPSPAVTSTQSGCSWNYTGTIAPQPPMPQTACAQSNAGAIAGPDAVHSYTCTCSSQTVVTTPAVVCPTTPVISTPSTPAPTSPAVPAGCSVRTGNWVPGLELRYADKSKNALNPRLTTSDNMAYRFTVPINLFAAIGRLVQLDYSTGLFDVSVSTNPCEWSADLAAKGCQAGGMDPKIHYGGSGSGYCAIDSTKTYYINVRQSSGGTRPASTVVSQYIWW